LCQGKHTCVTGETFQEKCRLRANNPLWAIRLGAGISHVIALAIEADNKHWAAVAFANGLVGCDNRRISTLGRRVANALAKTPVAKLVGAVEKFNAIVGVIRSKHSIHCAEVLVAKGK
jgi:hypothetical protein